MKFSPYLLVPVAAAAGWLVRHHLPPSAASQPVPTAAGGTADVIAAPLPDVSALDRARAAAALPRSSRSAGSALRAEVDSWDEATLRAAATRLLQDPRSMGNRGNQIALREAVLGRLAEIDPDAAVDAVRSLPAGHAQTVLHVVFKHLGEIESGTARNLLAGLSGTMRRTAVAGLAAGMAASDPQAALAFFDAEKIPPGDWIRNVAFGEWADRDPDGLAAAAAGYPQGPQRRLALEVAARAMGDRDPAAAVAWAGSLTHSSERAEALRHVFDSIGHTEPATGIRLLQSQPPDIRRTLMPRMAAHFMQTDPAAALAWIEGLTDRSSQLEAMRGMADPRFGSLDAEHASRLLALMPPGSARTDSLRSLGSSLAWQDPDNAMRWLDSLPVRDRQIAGTELAGALAWIDPERAAPLAASLDPTPAAIQSAAEVAGQLARRDPSAALRWAQTLEVPTMRQEAVTKALASWAENDPRAAASAAASLTDSGARRLAQNGIAETWAARDPAGAAAWATTLPPSERLAAMVRVWQHAAATDPAAIAGDLAAELPGAASRPADLEAMRFAADTLARSWAGNDPEAAGKWAIALPDENVRNHTAAAIVQRWAETDQEAASRWVDALPRGPMRDDAVASLVRAVAPGDPDAAFQWAASIGDHASRVGLMESTFASWHAADPTAARRALDAANIDPDLRAKLVGAVE